MILVKRAMKSSVSENNLAEYYNFPLRLVVGRATADELERETRLHWESGVFVNI